MTAAISRRDQLLGRLFELTRLETPLPCLCARAIHSHKVKAFDATGPLIALPLQGRKRALEAGKWISTDPGELFLVPGARRVDMENIPDAQSGEYVAVGITISENVLEAARQIIPDHPHAPPGPMASVPLDDLVESLLTWCEAMHRGQFTLACHAMLGVVLRLYEMGYQGLLTRPPERLADRIRAMVAEQPAREWASGDLEDAVGMSGATLRRHLAAEGTTLRDIIANARLAHALQLLYSTRLPVKSIAQRVGYASASSFTKRFTERYGVEPSRIGSLGSP